MRTRREKKALPLFTIAFIVGIFSTTSLATLAIFNLKNHEEETYANEVALARDLITQRLSGVDEVLHSVKALFDASSHVDANEFRILSENAFDRHQYINSFLYMPLVSDNERDAFEKKMRDEGYYTYAITENKNGQRQLSPPREKYFPIIYMEPFSPKNAASLGFDLLSETQNEAYIMHAIDSSESVILPIDAPNHTQQHMLVKPLYAGKDTPKTISERRHTINGMIALYIDSQKIIDGISLAENISLRLENIPLLQSQNNKLMLDHRQPLEDSDRLIPLMALTNQSQFNIGALQFSLIIDKHIAWKETRYEQVIAAFLVGIIITVLLLLLSKAIKDRASELQRRNQEIKNLVDQRTRELALEKDRAHITLASIGDGVITTNSDGEVDYINPAAEIITGWGRTDAIQKPIDEIFVVINEKTKKIQANPVYKCLTSKEAVILPEYSAVINQENNQAQAVEATVAPIVDDNNKLGGTVLVFHDVSEARKMSQQMTYQATHDALTGLPNRVLLIDRLKQALSRAPWNKKSVAVLFLDLDRFKIVNDTLGHEAGDELLCQIADRMENCIREGDTISRLGGDEFVIVLTDLAAEEDIPVVAKKFVDALAHPFSLNEQEFFISASIGISLFPAHGDDPFTLMKNADIAMYQAKNSGRNNFLFYDADMNSIDSKRLSLETDLRRALERDELELYYQPQIDIKTSTIIGAEALLRWNHSSLGLVSPMDFIPLAEETGLIVPIGQWVMEQACQQVNAWHHQGLKPIHIAVNIAHRQFNSGSLMLDVKRALSKSGLEARYLELELTEGILAENSHSAINTLNDLKKMGIKLSIDDFGTGYSSFAYLKRFPLNALKVDRCFVKDITQNKDDAAICSAIIAMAHNLNLHVVAEGVEDEEQLAFLKQHDCDFVQGFYYSRPVPAKNFAEMLGQAGAMPDRSLQLID